MPVVPFTPVPPRKAAAPEIGEAEAPWALMAAAQMDAEGRLIDRRDQSLKERDNEMVNDQQQRYTGKEIVNRLYDERMGRESKLGRALGADALKDDR